MQLPFRFFTAVPRGHVGPGRHDRLGGCWTGRATPSPTCRAAAPILADNSGSTQHCAVSGNAKLRVADAGNTLAAVLAKRLATRVQVGVFGDSLVWVPHTHADSCMAIKQRMDRLAMHGGADAARRAGDPGVSARTRASARAPRRACGGRCTT